jgi:hypothetical protein
VERHAVTFTNSPSQLRGSPTRNRSERHSGLSTVCRSNARLRAVQGQQCRASGLSTQRPEPLSFRRGASLTVVRVFAVGEPTKTAGRLPSTPVVWTWDGGIKRPGGCRRITG